MNRRILLQTDVFLWSPADATKYESIIKTIIPADFAFIESDSSPSTWHLSSSLANILSPVRKIVWNRFTSTTRCERFVSVCEQGRWRQNENIYTRRVLCHVYSGGFSERWFTAKGIVLIKRSRVSYPHADGRVWACFSVESRWTDGEGKNRINSESILY